MSSRGVTAVEAAIAAAILGTTLAVSVPACLREVHASRFAEPVSGLERIASATVRHAETSRDLPVAPLTPAKVPRGKLEVDPPGTWDHVAWRALDFRASAEGVPHAYSFETERSPRGLLARARGDLDGDGQTSVFEIEILADDKGSRAAPGMYVESEVE